MSISIVINTFNRYNSLIIAIDSVRRQNFNNGDFEILVVDDCSTDFDYRNLKEYCLITGIKLIRNQSNLGLAESRNVGIQAAMYEFVCFLDDDDIWIDENKLTKQLKLLTSAEDVALVCTDVMTWDGKDSEKANIEWPTNLLEHFFYRNGVIYPSTVMLRKSCALDVGGFDARFKRGIDSDLYRRLLLAGYIFCFAKEASVKYRVEANDKITDNTSSRGLKKDISSQILTIKKYWLHYTRRPSALFFRLDRILKNTIKLIIRS